MKKQWQRILAVTVVGIFAFGWIYYVWPTPWNHGRLDGDTIRTNRFTGEVQYLTLTGWVSGRPIINGFTAVKPNPVEDKEFLVAVLEGDVDVVERLLTAKPHLANAKGADGQTALEVAKDNTAMCELLRRFGAKP
jgi:hypothetical protein